MKRKSKILLIIVFNCIAMFQMFSFVNTLKTSGFEREYRLGHEEGKIEMYGQIERSGVKIPDSIHRPFVDKDLVLNLGEDLGNWYYFGSTSLFFLLGLGLSIDVAFSKRDG